MIQVTPLASDSMGCRSMATFVETATIKILIDPGVAIASMRFERAPHAVEKWRLKQFQERIRLFARSADVIVLTHYHSDHFLSDDIEIYRKKKLLVKNPNRKIDVHQRTRAFQFFQTVQQLADEIHYVDGREIVVGVTRFAFSDPFRFQIENETGYSVQVAVHENDHIILFTSDVNGLIENGTVDFIVGQNPELIYLDGPAVYLDEKVPESKVFQKQLSRIQQIIEKTQVTRIIIDHHLLRHLRWKQYIQPLYNTARQHMVLIQTAAEFRGEENDLLEARRKQLYEFDQPIQTT